MASLQTRDTSSMETLNDEVSQITKHLDGLPSEHAVSLCKLVIILALASPILFLNFTSILDITIPPVFVSYTHECIISWLLLIVEMILMLTCVQ